MKTSQPNCPFCQSEMREVQELKVEAFNYQLLKRFICGSCGFVALFDASTRARYDLTVQAHKLGLYDKSDRSDESDKIDLKELKLERPIDP